MPGRVAKQWKLLSDAERSPFEQQAAAANLERQAQIEESVEPLHSLFCIFSLFLFSCVCLDLMFGECPDWL